MLKEIGKEGRGGVPSKLFWGEESRNQAKVSRHGEAKNKVPLVKRNIKRAGKEEKVL